MVAILTGTVVLGFGGADMQQEVKGFAQRFAYRIELARQQALQRNREWGVYVEEQQYRFAEFDPELAEWVEQPNRPFRQGSIPDYLSLQLQMEGLAELPFVGEGDVPRLLVFSSGEITPFTLYMSLNEGAPMWVVHSDGLGQTRVRRPHELGTL